jgi:hypothetical protein
LKQIVLKYGKEQYGEDYSIEEKDKKLKLMWADLCRDIEIEYSGHKRTTWKEHLKTVVKDTKIAIGWKKV